MKHIFTIALTLSLAACGGGGSNVTPPDISQNIAQAAANTIANLPKPAGSTTPTSSGANVIIEGINGGWVAGTYNDEIARKVAQTIVDGATQYAPLYKLMLSDVGLHITVVSANSVSYVAKMTSNGVVLTRT